MHLLTTSLIPLLASFASAHFLLTYPAPIAYDYDESNIYPCGAFDITTRKPNVTDFFVDGTPVAMNTTHDVSIWIIRAALLSDVQENKNDFKFTDLTPTIRETGASGHFCEKDVKVPDSYVGKQGIIWVIQKAPGGALLYACAAVNFKSGAFKGDLPSGCNNATGAVASAITTSIPIPLPTSSGASGSDATSTPTGSSAAATTSSKSSASVLRPAFTLSVVVVGIAWLML